MVPWNEAYRRIREAGSEFQMLFGKMYLQDEFRYYAYGLKFDSVAPGLLAQDATHPNTGDLAVTTANIAAPTTNIVPGAPSDATLDFPIGAVILGISSGSIVAQRIVQVQGGAATNFVYGIGGGDGRRPLFLVDLEYSDGDPITSQNPIPETVFDPNVAFQAAPPYMADALMGGGDDSEMPGRELYVAPGLSLQVRVRSLVTPSFITTSSSVPVTPNSNVHLVFHAMVPGVVRQKKDN